MGLLSFSRSAVPHSLFPYALRSLRTKICGHSGAQSAARPHPRHGPIPGTASTLYSRNLLTMGSWRRNLMSLRR